MTRDHSGCAHRHCREQRIVTPRTLLTAIGATAIGFAVVITSIARSDAGPAPAAQTTMSIRAEAARTVALVPLDAVSVGSPHIASGLRSGAWNEDCKIAL
jgi:hypothetical protein